MGGRRLVRTVAALALVLPGVGCGARWSDEQAASVADRDAGDGGGDGATSRAATGATGTAGAGSQTATTTAASVGGTGGAGGAAAGGTGADAGGGGGAAAGGGALPCTAPSEAPGVTDGEITVGSIASLSGPVPGLGSSSAAAVRAYVAYRNATGGVCGRQIVLREADDGTDSARYRAIISDIGPQVLGIAGGFAFGDVGAAELIAEQALPIVGLPSGQSAADLPTYFDINPKFADPNAVIGKYRWLVEQGATKAALAYIAVDQSRYEANLQRGLMEAAGMEVVLQQELPLSTLSYDSAARAVANSGADYLFFIADVNGEAAMAQSLADTGYQLDVAEYFNFGYGTSFTELAGPAAEGAVMFLRSLPNEEAGSNAELGAFVEWMGQIAPGDDLDGFAVDSWAAAKAFFDTLEALPGPITRDAFVAQLSSIATFDAGGMYGPIQLGAEISNGCVIGMRYSGGQWGRLVPDSGFLC